MKNLTPFFKTVISSRATWAVVAVGVVLLGGYGYYSAMKSAEQARTEALSLQATLETQRKEMLKAVRDRAEFQEKLLTSQSKKLSAQEQAARSQILREITVLRFHIVKTEADWNYLDQVMSRVGNYFGERLGEEGKDSGTDKANYRVDYKRIEDQDMNVQRKRDAYVSTAAQNNSLLRKPFVSLLKGQIPEPAFIFKAELLALESKSKHLN